MADWKVMIMKVMMFVCPIQGPGLMGKKGDQVGFTSKDKHLTHTLRSNISHTH